jgi:hypothetical protein
MVVIAYGAFRSTHLVTTPAILLQTLVISSTPYWWDFSILCGGKGAGEETAVGMTGS